MNENIKLELELVGKLYKLMFATLAKTDGRLLEFESYIVRHFGHDGTTLIRTINDRHSDGPVVLVQQPRQGKQLQAFVYPNTKKNVAQPNPALANMTQRGKVNTAEEPLIQTANKGDQFDIPTGGGNPPLTSSKPPVVAVDGGDDHSATPINTTQMAISTDAEITVDTADAKTMRAAAFGKKYGIELLRKFLEQQGVEYSNNSSVTQLASLVIKTINQARK